MPQSFIAYFPLAVVYAVVVMAALTFGAKAGAGTPALTIGALAAAVLGLVFIVGALL